MAQSTEILPNGLQLLQDDRFFKLGQDSVLLSAFAKPRRNAKLLDLGCGSGILSIAALLLGAKDAFACDIDDKCIGVAYENAALNGVGREHYTVRAGDVLSDKGLQKEFGGDYDVIVANIVADVIIALAPQVGRLLKKGGIFLCSGIIDDRAEEVREKLVEAGPVPAAGH